MPIIIGIGRYNLTKVYIDHQIQDEKIKKIKDPRANLIFISKSSNYI